MPKKPCCQAKLDDINCPIWKALLKIALKRNIFVYWRELPQTINGIHFKRNGIEAIGLNSALSGEKTSFILAHELGRAQLHSELTLPYTIVWGISQRD